MSSTNKNLQCTCFLFSVSFNCKLLITNENVLLFNYHYNVCLQRRVRLVRRWFPGPQRTHSTAQSSTTTTTTTTWGSPTPPLALLQVETQGRIKRNWLSEGSIQFRNPPAVFGTPWREFQRVPGVPSVILSYISVIKEDIFERGGQKHTTNKNICTFT